MKKFGILGGSFNPPHIAHSIVADSVREQLELDKIIFIPSGNHPLKNSLSGGHRYEMSRLAFGRNENFEVSDIEVRNPEEKSYTVDTLQKLTKLYENDNVKLFLIIGIDNLIELHKWKEPGKLFRLSKVIVINRPDYDISNSHKEFSKKAEYITVPYLEISSTIIRKRVYEGRSIKYVTAEKVEEYIYKNNLYR
ncbi:MAG: nicotinate-nucleotide adenylyltransferase [bacterium]